MRTYEITADKKLRMTEDDVSIVSIGRILFIVAEGIEFILADNAMVGHRALIRTELLNSAEHGYQLRAIATDSAGQVLTDTADENFNVTLVWDTIRTDDGKSYHRPNSAAALQAAA